MAEEKKETISRNKPKFFRKDWNKKIKLGSKIKKKRKWRGAKGIQNKTRLNKAGYAKKPRVGWGNKKSEEVSRVENLAQLENIKEKKIILAKVGKKKREEMKKIAEKKGIIILNKYRRENESS